MSELQELQERLKEFNKSDNKKEPVEFTVRLEGSEAYIYRLVHIVWEKMMDEGDEDNRNQMIFLTGLDKIIKNSTMKAAMKEQESPIIVASELGV